MSILNAVPQRGIDFIYRLVDIYNREANDEKNEVAQKTAEFIEERIAIIDRELGSTEESLANFKQRSRLTDLESDAQMALQETSRPIHIFGKNFLKDHAHVETIVIQSGTKSLEAYAFENCPRLQKAYIPVYTCNYHVRYY